MGNWTVLPLAREVGSSPDHTAWGKSSWNRITDWLAMMCSAERGRVSSHKHIWEGWSRGPGAGETWRLKVWTTEKAELPAGTGMEWVRTAGKQGHCRGSDHVRRCVGQGTGRGWCSPDLDSLPNCADLLLDTRQAACRSLTSASWTVKWILNQTLLGIT